MKTVINVFVFGLPTNTAGYTRSALSTLDETDTNQVEPILLDATIKLHLKSTEDRSVLERIRLMIPEADVCHHSKGLRVGIKIGEIGNAKNCYFDVCGHVHMLIGPIMENISFIGTIGIKTGTGHISLYFDFEDKEAA